MKKNVGSQIIGVQMVSATDGSAFTSAVTVYVTGDGGTQAVGSVSSGACTHEGNGFHTYVPAQAETNYAHVAFTFIGTGAVPATVQVYTSFPQTVDNATNISAIKTKTDYLPSVTAGGSGGVMISGTNSGTTTLGALTVTGATTYTGAVTASNASNNFRVNGVAPGAAGGMFIAGTNAATTITTGLTTTFTGNLTGSVGSVTGAVGSVTGNVGGNVTGSVGSVTGAVGSVTGNVGGNVVGSVASVTGAVTIDGTSVDLIWDETLTGHVTADSAGVAVKDILADTNELQTDDYPTTLATLATASALATVDTVVDGIQTDLSNGTDGLGAIKTAVDAIPTSNPTAAAIADAVWDESAASHVAAGSTGEALGNATAPTAAQVADAVWEEAIADHSGTSGSTAESLAAAGGSGDPWITSLPGSYTGTQAGKILADILDDTGTTIPGTIATVDANVDAILADTADMQPKLGTPAGASMSADIAAVKSDTGAILTDTAEIGAAGAGLTALATASALATVDSNVDAILVDTGTTLPASIDALPTAAENRAEMDSNSTKLATIVADTGELQTDWANGGRMDLLIDAIKVVTDALPDSGALTSLATAAALATVDGNVDAILVDTDATIPGLISALNDLSAGDILTTQLTESYAADGTSPTLSQAIFLIQQFLYERSTSGATVTVKKLDGSTTAATLTLDDDTAPTSITRAS